MLWLLSKDQERCNSSEFGCLCLIAFQLKYSQNYSALHALVLFCLYYIYIFFFFFHFWVHGLVGSVVGMKKIIIVTCIFSTGLGFWEKELMLILFKAFWTQNLIKPTIHSTKVFLVYMNIVVDSVSTFHIILNCYFIWLQNYRFWILLLSMSSYPFY